MLAKLSSYLRYCILLFIILFFIAPFMWYSVKYLLEIKEFSIPWTEYSQVFFFTLKQALISSLLLVILAFIIARYLYGYQGHIFKRICQFLLFLPFFSSPVLFILAYILVINDFASFLSDDFTYFLFSIYSLIAFNILSYLGLISFLLESAFRRFPQQYKEISITLKISKSLYFRKIIWPFYKNYFLEAIILSFVLSFNNFLIIFLMGGLVPNTIEMQAYEWSQIGLYSPSFLLLWIANLVFLVIFIFYIYFSHKKSIWPVNTQTLSLFIPFSKKIAMSSVLTIFYILPLLYLIIYLLRRWLSTDIYENISYLIQLFKSDFFIQLMANFSLLFIGSFILSCLIFTILFYRYPLTSRLIHICFTFILFLSPLTVSIPYRLLANNYFTHSYIYLYIILSFCNASLICTVLYRFFIPIREQFPKMYIEIYQTFQPNFSLYFSHIILPYYRYFLIFSCIYIFTYTLNEVNLTFLLSQGTIYTLATAIFTALHKYRLYEAICLSLVNIFFSLVYVIIIYRISSFFSYKRIS